MKISLKLHCILFVIVLVFGCNKNNWQETTTGLKYIIHEAKGGKKAHYGDGLQLHMIYKNAADSVIFDSNVLGNAFTIELTEPHYKGSIEEGFLLLGEGDSASFITTADSVYAHIFGAPLPTTIIAGEKLQINVRINKVLTPNEYKTMMRAQHPEEVIDEDALIKRYLATNQLAAISDTSGLYYISFVNGSGKQPKTGDNLEVSYLVRALSGELFDASENAFKFKLGDTAMVKGWNIGMAMMREKGKARFIVPSKLGYGAAGNGKIPPHTPLVFDVDLIKVK